MFTRGYIENLCIQSLCTQTYASSTFNPYVWSIPIFWMIEAPFFFNQVITCIFVALYGLIKFKQKSPCNWLSPKFLFVDSIPDPAGNTPPASKDTVSRPLRAVASAKTCWEVTLENMRRSMYMWRFHGKKSHQNQDFGGYFPITCFPHMIIIEW